jgi:exopolysaccharide production protein ExoZ
MAQRIRSLQALRGVACLAVAVYHLAFWENLIHPHRPLVFWTSKFGWVGVDLFFVLSGFIITWTQQKHLGEPASLGGYVGRRLWRIFPLYWACWIGATIACFVFWGVPIGNHNGLLACMKQIFLWPWNCGQPYLPVAWSLTYEVMFYVLFAVFIVLPRRWFVPLLATWTAIVLGKLLFFPAFRDDPTWLPVAPLTFEFLVGCWTALIFRRWSRGAVVCLTMGLVGLAIGTACLEIWLLPSGPWRSTLLGPPAGLVVYSLASLERVGRFRPANWLCRIGDASYSIYLTHWTIGTLLISKMVRWPHTFLGHPVWVAIVLGGMIGIGYLWHLAVERQLLRMVETRRSAPVAVGVPSPERQRARAA